VSFALDEAMLACQAHYDARIRLGAKFEPFIWQEPSRATNGTWCIETVLGLYCVVNEDGIAASLEGYKAWEWEMDEDPRAYSIRDGQIACKTHFEDAIMSALDLEAMEPRLSVTIKPLDWRENTSFSIPFWSADTIHGCYSVAVRDDKASACLNGGSNWTWEPYSWDALSPETAKLACERHNEHRIRSALDLWPVRPALAS
jgi:hypothetical protein